MVFRPMLADNKKVTQEQIQRHLDECGFLIGQPKIDGMRSLIDEECIPRSRSGKEHKNIYLRAFARHHPSLRGADGELVSGLQYDPTSFRASMSGIRSEVGSPEFTFYVFDFYLGDIAAQNYDVRRSHLRDRVANLIPDPDVGSVITAQDSNIAYHAKLVMCPQQPLYSLEEVNAYDEENIKNGWEGTMLRRPDRPYKYNRSTNVGGELIKLKQYDDDEAVVVGCYPWERNDNEATTDVRGYTVRSAHQGNKIAMDRLGGFHCELLRDRSVKFDIGVFRGWSHGDRDRLWTIRDSLVGRILKFKHQGYGGGYDCPRTPVGLGWRDADDL